MATAQPIPPSTICRMRIAAVERQLKPPACVLVTGSKTLVSRSLANHLAPGDELLFPLPDSSSNTETEIYVTKNSFAGPPGDLYQATIGYVTPPKKDKRGQFFVAAEVPGGRLGFLSVFLPSEALREYFFRIPCSPESSDQGTLYDLLRIAPVASPAELRVAFKIRQLELEASQAPRGEHMALERAFNILGQPELRVCYDALLTDPEAPALFPYGGFGALLTAGERSRDGRTFFAHRILAYIPERRERRFRAALRRCDFYNDRALYHDVARKLDLWLDPGVLHRVWDATWNQWKHFLGTKMEVTGTFVHSGKYRRRRGQWELARWEIALPSRLEVKLPADADQQIQIAKQTHHRFGQYANALERIRARIEYEPVEKSALEKMCGQLRIPGDFDISQITWRPDYDPFFYRQLASRARRIYLFRDEYIFELERAVVVETPQLGNATYVFVKPRNIGNFLAAYVKLTKDDIRRNRNNAAERLRFIGRAIHGTNPRAWLKDLKRRIGERAEGAPEELASLSASSQ